MALPHFRRGGQGAPSRRAHAFPSACIVRWRVGTAPRETVEQSNICARRLSPPYETATLFDTTSAAALTHRISAPGSRLYNSLQCREAAEIWPPHIGVHRWGTTKARSMPDQNA